MNIICIMGEAKAGKTRTLLRAASTASINHKIYVHSTEMSPKRLGEKLLDYDAFMENIISGHSDIFDSEEFIGFIKGSEVEEIYLDMPMLNLKWDDRMKVADKVKQLSVRTGCPIYWTQQVRRENPFKESPPSS